MTDLSGLTPCMPSQCFSCAHWFELNGMWSCHDCGDCEIRCGSCHRSHSDTHVDEDDETDDAWDDSPHTEGVNP